MAPKFHESITDDRVAILWENSNFGTDNVGACIRCGVDAEDVDPDEDKGTCTECHHRTVWGSTALVLAMA